MNQPGSRDVDRTDVEAAQQPVGAGDSADHGVAGNPAAVLLSHAGERQ
jgi:hypothetical protein